MRSKLPAFVLTFVLALLPMTSVTALAQEAPQLRAASERDALFLETLSAAVRHELMMLPYYDVFDWLEAEVSENGEVVLRGSVVDGPTRSSAEARVRRLESVSNVINEIEVLPPGDDGLRMAIYRAIYDRNSPLARYATRAVQPIHILVKNGRATLRGVVDEDSHRQFAFMAARSVPGLFEVRNELEVH